MKPLNGLSFVDILFFRALLLRLCIAINLFWKSVVIEGGKRSKNFLRKSKISSNYDGYRRTFVRHWIGFIHLCGESRREFTISFVCLYYLSHFLTTVLAFILLKERIDVWQWILVGLCVISCLILSYGNFKDLIYSVIIALSFGFYLVSQRKNSDFDKFLILTIQRWFRYFITVWSELWWSSSNRVFILFFTFNYCNCLHYLFFMFLNLYALKGLNSQLLILMYTNPLIHFFLAIFFF